MNQKLLDYFNGDELAANVWLTKYAAEGEETPNDMHWRLANEFGRIEKKYQEGERELFIHGHKSELSEYGRTRLDLSKKSIFNLFKDFKYIIPQGRVMAGLGIMESYRSLSNCTVLPSPKDSYNSIMKTDTMLVNSAKRGMGYGLDISNLRPRGANVSNAAKSSTGAVSFMERFSNSTREVAQSGRRGACLMSINVNHPDIEEFINIKKDLTKITGANISIKLNDEFINAVKNNEDYVLRFPENAQLTKTYEIKNIELGKLYEINGEYFKYVSAKELWDKIIKAARDNSEPGLFMWDNVIDRDPSSVYEKFKPICTNACFTGDTLILTSNGYKELKDIKIGEEISTAYGKEKVDNIEFNKNLQIYRVKFSDGGYADVTENHVFYGKVAGDPKKINKEIRTHELKVGDYVKVQRTHNVIDKSYDGYMLNLKRGIFLGDGSYTTKTKAVNSVTISSNQDDVEYNKNIKNLFKSTRKLNPSKNSKSVHIPLNKGVEIVDELDLPEYTNASNKNIKMSWLKSEGDFMGILDGLLATDGNINCKSNHPQIRWFTCSEKMAQSIRLCLLAIGCQGRIHEKNDEGGVINGRKIKRVNKMYVVSTSGESLHTYITKSRLQEIHPVKGNKLKKMLKNFSLTGSTWYANVKSIEKINKQDTYDLFCKESDTWAGNGYMSRGCGEEPMAFGDTCRLICINLFSFVNNPFTENASVDYKKVYEICYEQLRLGDDLVDLEIEYIKRIINKIQNENDNDSDIELEMWTNTLNVAKEGRRTGCGLTGLGDMLAGLNLKYDSKEAIDVVEKVMRTKFKAELDCSIDLSILRGPFKAWDKKLEYKDLDDESNEDSTNSFYSFLKENFKEECARMYHWGRRNINWSTVSPTGSVSILTQTTSGCEPLFQPFYMRRKKVNPDDENIRVDFTDQNGDTWQEYPVLHSKFKDYMLSKYSLLDLSTYSQEDLKREFEKSPWYNSTANDINWNKRIEMQSILQKYTTAAISSTINLPENVSEKTVEEIYLNAWNIGLKGVTVYRDGSRSGVLVSKKEEKKNNFFTVDAFKRQNPTAAQSYITSVNGEKYTVIVGCIDNNPYEVFAMKGSFFNRQDGEIHKISSGNYSFVTNKNNYEEIQFNMNDVQEDTCKLISGMLRHRMSAKYIVDILTKGSGKITGFNKAIARILKKYIKNGEKIDKKCSECGSASLMYQEGCLTCNNCGYSKC